MDRILNSLKYDLYLVTQYFCGYESYLPAICDFIEHLF